MTTDTDSRAAAGASFSAQPPLVSTPAAPPGTAAASLQTGVVMPTPQAPRTNVTKVVVAVHGVGDQYQYATIQSVVAQFCRFYHAPPATPLGSFHNGQTAYAFSPPFPAKELESFAFAEVYWARIPQQVVSDQHTLEDAQNWARTIVERMRLRWQQRHRDGETPQKIDFPLVKRVLTEMIETLTVMERLSFLAERGGLFRFDMRKLVDDYLGDVQVVADFASQRRKILDAFHDAMAGAHKQYPNAELFVIAHSEGTVVTLLGLLEAFRAQGREDWTDRIRGVMTIGSPIDKHLGLWPELFEGGAVDAPATPIRWVNYYDLGDPIGFDLDDFRDFIAHGDLQQLFDFPAENDIGFSRYAFPGKAHVDYWNDDAIFRHFIGEVVAPPTAPDGAPATATEHATVPKPTDKPFNSSFCYAMPYGMVCILLFIAAYLPVKSVSDFAGWELGVRGLARDIAAVVCALFATTIAVRIPRLTARRAWHAVIWLFFLGFVSVGAALLEVHAPGWQRYEERFVLLALLTCSVIVATRVADALVRRFAVDRNVGAKPMLVFGTAALLGTMVLLIEGGWRSHMGDGKLWPIVLSTAAFVYLWWLAALLFDLAFVWHVYIRHAEAIKPLRRKRTPRTPATTAPSPRRRKNTVGTGAAVPGTATAATATHPPGSHATRDASTASHAT